MDPAPPATTSNMNIDLTARMPATGMPATMDVNIARWMPATRVPATMDVNIARRMVIPIPAGIGQETTCAVQLRILFLRAFLSFVHGGIFFGLIKQFFLCIDFGQCFLGFVRCRAFFGLIKQL